MLRQKELRKILQMDAVKVRIGILWSVLQSKMIVQRLGLSGWPNNYKNKYIVCNKINV